MSDDIIVRLLLDGDQYRAGLRAADDENRKFAKGADESFTRVKRSASEAAAAVGNSAQISARQTAAAMRGLPAQFTDIVVQLQGGANPLTVLLQQGGQIKDMFGGLRPAISALASVLTPTVLGVGALTAGVGLLAAAYLKGQGESEAFRDMIAMTGNAAGITEGQFNSLAQRVKESTGVTIASAREVTQGLVSTGRFGTTALDSVSAAAARVAEVSGATAEDVVKDFANMSGNVAAWAAKHNESWNFATADQIDYIRQLEETGRSQQAMIEVGNMLTSHLAQQRENLGLLESAWKGVRGAASTAWDAMLSIGRSNTVNDQIKAVQKRLDEWRTANPTYSGAPAAQQEIAALQAQLQMLNRDALRQADAATTRAYSAQQERDAISRREELRNVTARLSSANQQYIKDLKTIQASAAAGEITEAKRLELLTEAAKKYGEKPKAGPKGKTAAQIADEQEREYQKMVRATLAGRGPRLANIEGEQSTAASAAAEANMAASVGELRRRNDEAEQLMRGYATEVKAINADMLTDERERAFALLELERQSQQDRLDALAAYGADVRNAQAELDAYIVARQGQLTQQLKPQWQQTLDAWRDTNRLMRETWDGTMGRMIQGGEDAWVTFVTTGKVQISGLVQTALADLARMEFRKSIAPTFASAAGSLMGALGFSQPGGEGRGGGSVQIDKAGEKLGESAGDLTGAALSFLSPIQGLMGAGQSIIQSALGWLLPQTAQTTAAVTMGTAGAALGTAAGALIAAAGALSAAAAGQMASVFAADGAMIDGTGWHAATAFAAGGAFGAGEVLTKPTMFRFRQNGAVRLGIAGEAGAEAALPMRAGGVVASIGGVSAGSLPLRRSGGLLGVDLTGFANSIKARSVRQFATGGAFDAGGPDVSGGFRQAASTGSGSEAPVVVKQQLVFQGNGVNRAEMADFARKIQVSTHASVMEAMKRGRR